MERNKETITGRIIKYTRSGQKKTKAVKRKRKKSREGCLGRQKSKGNKEVQ